MKYFLVILIFVILAPACSRVMRPALVPIDVSTALEKDKVTLLGQLKQTNPVTGMQSSLIDRNYEVVTTESEDKYFLKNNHVVSSSRKPKVNERTLMYWRIYFKGRLYREQLMVANHKHVHAFPDLQIACDSLGMGIIYDQNREIIKRVFYYVKK